MTIEQDWDNSKLGTYLLYDEWGAGCAMYLLAGLDYFRGDFDFLDRKLSHENYEQWTPQMFVIRDQFPLVYGDAERLREIWRQGQLGLRLQEKRELLLEDYTHSPAFFIEWAISKNSRPPLHPTI